LHFKFISTVNSCQKLKHIDVQVISESVCVQSGCMAHTGSLSFWCQKTSL